jgi:alkanesulfonate monooxygenase SsuD/methylene tetrahydromethanopterin reductase-like flavin-dependent oxidoreductase (luciferase family)
MAVEFGLSLLAGPPKGQPERFIEDLDASLPHLGDSISSLWMTDHFFWNEDPTHEAWTVMAYLSAYYPTLMIGPMVLGQSYRNPALTAKMAATLQSLSKGRFYMGIGAGWKEDEYRAYGYDYPTPKIRLEQLEDTLEILTRLWTEPGKVTYHGKHYHIEDAICEPKPEPMIPIVVGGGGEKTMSLAVKYAQMWNLSDATIDRYRDRLAILRRHCETQGREWNSIRKSWFGRVAVGRTAAEAEARGGGKWRRDNAFLGTPVEIVEQMNAFVAVDCDFFMIDILGLPDADVMSMVVEEVIPKVG